MPDLLKTAAVLILIVFLLRRKVSMSALMPRYFSRFTSGSAASK
jgi:hypothetical protein